MESLLSGHLRKEMEFSNGDRIVGATRCSVSNFFSECLERNALMARCVVLRIAAIADHVITFLAEAAWSRSVAVLHDDLFAV